MSGGDGNRDPDRRRFGGLAGGRRRGFRLGGAQGRRGGPRSPEATRDPPQDEARPLARCATSGGPTSRSGSRRSRARPAAPSTAMEAPVSSSRRRRSPSRRRSGSTTKASTSRWWSSRCSPPSGPITGLRCSSCVSAATRSESSRASSSSPRRSEPASSRDATRRAARRRTGSVAAARSRSAT